MTPKTIESSDNPTNGAQIERTFMRCRSAHTLGGTFVAPKLAPQNCQASGSATAYFFDGNNQPFSSLDIPFYAFVPVLKITKGVLIRLENFLL